MWNVDVRSTLEEGLNYRLKAVKQWRLKTITGRAVIEYYSSITDTCQVDKISMDGKNRWLVACQPINSDGEYGWMPRIS